MAAGTHSAVKVNTTVEVQNNIGAEIIEAHTRLLRVPLIVDASRAYWEHWRPDIPADQRHVVAFEERWFGSKTMARVRGLLLTLQLRFDSYPDALQVLRGWRPKNPITRSMICHWHAQLTDPTYRAFTGEFLEYRRNLPERSVDRAVVVTWLQDHLQGKWASATTIRMANSLLTTASEAGLCTAGAGKRDVLFPNAPDEALSYLLYLLRGVRFAGTLLDNPYVASVGLTGGFLEQRLRRLPSLSFSRMADVHDFGWKYPDLAGWAEGAGVAPRVGT